MDTNTDWPRDVLRFWFEETEAQQWFTRDAAFDERVRQRFASLYEQMAPQPVGAFDTALNCLAAVIVLDQFPRNLFRSSARAFATDALALAQSRYAIERGLDQALSPPQRMFLYMPWQHAEDAAIQAQSVRLFEQLGLDEALHYAREHRRVIELFGRFPHRNAVLGRPSTAAEIEFMKTHPGF